MNSSGTDEYISRIVEQYSQTLFRVSYTILHSSADAEDIVQEVFVQLLRKTPVFNGAEHEKAWLLRTAINMSRNKLKSSARKIFSLEELPAADFPVEESDLIDAVMSLPEKYSTVLHLYYYEDYSIADIARILKTPAATIGTRLSRARALLKNKLKGDKF